MPRLFIAVELPPQALEAIDALAFEGDPRVRWVPRQNWHITLRFLGECPLASVMERLQRSTLPSAEVVLGPTVARLFRSVIAVPAAGLDELAAGVVAATADIGDPPEKRDFRGHVTIGRLRGRGRVRLVGTPVAARFTVREVALMSSELTPEGAVHTPELRWPIGAGEP